MIELTSDLEFRLSQLKNLFIALENGSIGVIRGWSIKEVKYRRLFGRSRLVRVLESVSLKMSNQIGTKWLNTYDAVDLYKKVPGNMQEWSTIDMLEEARKRFITMRNELDKFGYIIKARDHR